MSDPVAELREAASLMREQHGPDHPRHAFWVALADWLDERARDYEDLANGPYGQAGAAFVAGDHGGDYDPALKVARTYLGRTDG